jgi:hypothetical protein
MIRDVLVPPVLHTALHADSILPLGGPRMAHYYRMIFPLSPSRSSANPLCSPPSLQSLSLLPLTLFTSLAHIPDCLGPEAAHARGISASERCFFFLSLPAVDFSRNSYSVFLFPYR